MSKVGSEGEIEDHQTHVLDLAEANRRPDQTPVWQHLYSARSAYQVHLLNVNPKCIFQIKLLSGDIYTAPDLHTRWFEIALALIVH